MNHVKSMLSEKTNGDDVYNLTYKYDLAGNRRSASETVSGQSTRNLTWDYDGLYRLVEEKWTGPQAQTRSYEYDRAGNRTMRTIDATASGGAKTYTRFTYDKLNRLTFASTSGTPGVSYEYDRNGNQITKREGSDITRYTYDVSNRLIDAKINNTTVFAAAYDARTRRLGKTEGGTSTIFRYDGGTNVQEVNTSNVVTMELIRAGGLGGGIGSILYTDKSMVSSGPKEYFIYNAVGHTMALTDASQNVTQTNLYEAFGETIVKTGSSTNNRLANTKERDASIGLDNHGFRYYDPESGRYITRDPLRYKDGLNVYASSHNNPITNVDPLGLAIINDFVGPTEGNHFYPGYLGGSNEQPVGSMTQSEHQGFHQYFEDEGIGFMAENTPAAQEAWGEMGLVEHVNHIINAGAAANLSGEKMNALEANMPAIVAGATPGTKWPERDYGDSMWRSIAADAASGNEFTNDILSPESARQFELPPSPIQSFANTPPQEGYDLETISSRELVTPAIPQ